MQAIKHNDYQQETKQLEDTIQWVQVQSNKLKQEEQELEKEVIATRKEVSSAMDPRLALAIQMHQTAKEDIDKLAKVQRNPYFGRIDFKEKYGKEVEEIYIGKYGLYDSKQLKMLVVDWRAPIANLYYSGMDEEVTYHAPNGNVRGKVHLKRRYVINDGLLVEILDEKSIQDNLKDTIAKDAGFLIDSLNKSTSGRLTEIVETIQDQQNKIIRSEGSLPLIVQGVAGSGKTTIALHRMAYLIYNRQHDRDARYMVVAPNKLFLNYIEGILPDLGVNNVFQTTFEGWVINQLDKKIHVVLEDKLDTLLTNDKTYIKQIILAAKLRGSIVFKRIIDFKIKQLERNLIGKEGVCFEGVTLITSKEIRDAFYVSNQHLPLQARMKLLGDYLKKRLKFKQALIQGYIESQYEKRIKDLKQSVDDIEQVREEIIALYDERDEKVKGIKKWIPKFVKKYMKVLPTTKEFYLNIFKEKEWIKDCLAKQIAPEVLDNIILYLEQNFVLDKFETEDLGPLMYIQIKLYGLKDAQKYAHIVVDEAQDLDEMKLAVLREVSLNDSFTLVGDLSQGIYSYKGITNWQRMMKKVFQEKKYNYCEMTTNYRSTIEIVELANEVISQCSKLNPTKVVPVLRHGTKPKLVYCEHEEVKVGDIIKDIAFYQSQDMTSICILTESKEESEKLYNRLQARGQALEWIKEEGDTYSGNVAIMPGYLSKGLEFDTVIINDVSSRGEAIEPLDIKLIYVMITRALHHLKMYTIGQPISILRESDWIEEVN